MKVMWVAPNGGNYNDNIIKGTGGWIGALEDALLKMYPNLELCICFLSTDKNAQTLKRGNVTYTPVYQNQGNSFLGKMLIRHFRDEQRYTDKLANKIADTIKLYKPDIIHVWGLENLYSKVIPLIKDTPIVVHIQGLTSNYYFYYYPAGYNNSDAKHIDGFFNRYLLKRGYCQSYKSFKQRAQNELRIAPYVRNWIGRTHWDKNMANLLSPNARYYSCNELMRPTFSECRWEYRYSSGPIKVASTVSQQWYKGLDLVLKTCKVLKELGYEVEWHLYGMERESSMTEYMMRREGVIPEEVGIQFHGHVDAETLIQGLLNCDVYMHPSYIENSSNAIAEAMLLGMPVIANNVGGNASMLSDNSGILVPANEPYALASAILKMRDEETAKLYATKARDVAKKRHDPTQVTSKLMSIYRDIVGDK